MRAVKVDKVTPKARNKAKYKLSRKLYYYTIGEPTGESKKFLDWAIKSDDAKAIINNWLGLVYQLTNLDRREQYMEGVDPDNPLKINT